jgi:hypothetical protein
MTGQNHESDDTEPRMFRALRRLLQARNIEQAPTPPKAEDWWQEPTEDPALGPDWNGGLGR